MARKSFGLCHTAAASVQQEKVGTSCSPTGKTATHCAHLLPLPVVLHANEFWLPESNGKQHDATAALAADLH
jgi:hypothetical protein